MKKPGHTHAKHENGGEKKIMYLWSLKDPKVIGRRGEEIPYTRCLEQMAAEKAKR